MMIFLLYDDMILLNNSVFLKETGALDTPALSGARLGGVCGAPHRTAEHTRVMTLWDRPINRPLILTQITQR